MAAQTEQKRIIIVIVLLIVLILGIFVVRGRNKANLEQKKNPEITDNVTSIIEEQKDQNIIFLTSDKTNLEVGEELSVNISFTAPGKKLFGSDVILLYDPDLLTTSEANITQGNFFGSYPRKTVDPINGIVKVNAFMANPENAVMKAYDIFSVKFKALKKGTARISLSFEKGKTNLTTLVEAETSMNILENTTGISISIDE